MFTTTVSVRLVGGRDAWGAGGWAWRGKPQGVRGAGAAGGHGEVLVAGDAEEVVVFPCGEGPCEDGAVAGDWGVGGPFGEVLGGLEGVGVAGFGGGGEELGLVGLEEDVGGEFGAIAQGADAEEAGGAVRVEGEREADGGWEHEEVGSGGGFGP